MPEKKALRETLAGLKKRHGENVIGCGDKVAMRDRRVSSGSFLLDMALGGTVDAGFGFIIGRVHAFWGEKSGGKTTTAYRAVGAFQRMCRNCWRPAKNVTAVPPTPEELAIDPEARWTAIGECDCYAKGLMDYEIVRPEREKDEKAKDYADRVQSFEDEMTKNSYEEPIVAFIDAECAFEKKYFSNFGDPRRLLLVVPTLGEGASDIAHGLASSGVIDLMVLDSLAHFIPKDEVDSSAYDSLVAVQARLVNRAVRKMIQASASNHYRKRRLTQIWINQKRMKVGITFGDPSVKPAGLGQDFSAHVEIMFRNSKTEEAVEQWGSKDKGELISRMKSEKFSFVVKKNKYASTKNRVLHYEQEPDGTIIENKAIYKMAMKQLVKEEKKASSGDRYFIGKMGFKTQKEIMDAIENDQEIRDAIKTALYIRNIPGAD